MLYCQSSALHHASGESEDTRVLMMLKPLSELLERLQHRVAEARKLWPDLSRGADINSSALIPNAVAINADLINLLGINCGDR